ncbi:MAG: hypothetical protein KJO69_03675 [Gammaproteobacteria bacterium]|nr:hypothetical protein [Gammaproteobacteria bacterium]NNJ71712.1 hypothetical protein [Enterobacterales bacterium]
MLLRRFMAHTKEQNWFAVGLDVIVVIVGIYLGMQVSDWNDSNNKVKTEIQYLTVLNQDLQRIDERLLDKLEFEIAQAKLANYVYELLSKDDFDSHKQLIAAGLNDLTIRRSAFFTSPVYIDLLSSGNLTIIRNEVLRNEVIAFFSELEFTALILEKNSKQFVDEGFVPLIRNNFSSLEDSSGLPDEYRSVVSKRFEGIVKDIVTTNISAQTDPTLALPIDNEIWPIIRRALSWRFSVSLGDKNSVESIRTRGHELSKKITAYLESLK